jgi:hypothetical protein
LRRHRQCGLWSARPNQNWFLRAGADADHAERCPGRPLLLEAQKTYRRWLIAGQQLPPRRELAFRLEVVTTRQIRGSHG